MLVGRAWTPRTHLGRRVFWTLTVVVVLRRVQITGKKMHSTLWYLQHSPA